MLENGKKKRERSNVRSSAVCEMRENEEISAESESECEADAGRCLSARNRQINFHLYL